MADRAEGAVSGRETGRLVRRFWEAFLEIGADGQGGLAALVTPDVHFRGSLGIAVRGGEGIADYRRRAGRVFGDFHVAVGEVIAEGDRGAARLMFSGTHRGELFGIAPTGERVEYPGMAWMRLEGGRFADIWVMGDAAEWMARLHGLRVP